MRLLKNKLVLKKAGRTGKSSYKHIQAWTQAVKAARKELKVTGFVAVGGKTQQGKAIYVKAIGSAHMKKASLPKPLRKGCAWT